ncbi:hypothetical protein Tco_0279106 [Tanacetum coccineum]
MQERVTIVKKAMDDPPVIVSGIQSFGDVHFDQAVNIETKESLSNTESEIKFVGKVDLNHEMKNNADITFMGSFSFDQEMEVVDSDLKSMPKYCWDLKDFMDS